MDNIMKHHRAMFACLLGIGAGEAPADVRLGIMRAKHNGVDRTVLVCISVLTDEVEGTTTTCIEPLGVFVDIGDVFGAVAGATRQPPERSMEQSDLDKWTERATDFGWLESLDQYNTERLLWNVKGSA